MRGDARLASMPAAATLALVATLVCSSSSSSHHCLPCRTGHARIASTHLCGRWELSGAKLTTALQLIRPRRCFVLCARTPPRRQCGRRHQLMHHASQLCGLVWFACVERVVWCARCSWVAARLALTRAIPICSGWHCRLLLPRPPPCTTCGVGQLPVG